MAFVAISIMNFVLETHPICKIDKETGKSMSVLEPEDLTPTGSIMVGQQHHSYHAHNCHYNVLIARIIML